MKARAFFLGAVALLVGCAAMRPMTASSDDLADYRRTRLAATVPEHLVASEQYLARHPNGAWATEVRADYEREELAYFTHAQSSRARAIEYLSWLPRGPHADAALAVVRSFDGQIADDETAHLVAAAKRTTTELDARANERKQIQEELLAAIAAIVRAPIGAPLEQAPDLERVVRGTRSATWGDGLARRERYLWVLPAKSGPVERELDASIEVGLREGVVVFAELRGAGLVARLAELAATRPFADADDAAALAYVDDVVRGAMTGRIDPAQCKATTDARGIARVCGVGPARVALTIRVGDMDSVRIEKTRE